MMALVDEDMVDVKHVQSPLNFPNFGYLLQHVWQILT